jgi:hypothetical protein
VIGETGIGTGVAVTGQAQAGAVHLAQPARLGRQRQRARKQRLFAATAAGSSPT